MHTCHADTSFHDTCDNIVSNSLAQQIRSAFKTKTTIRLSVVFYETPPVHNKTLHRKKVLNFHFNGRYQVPYAIDDTQETLIQSKAKCYFLFDSSFDDLTITLLFRLEIQDLQCLETLKIHTNAYLLATRVRKCLKINYREQLTHLHFCLIVRIK